MKEESADPEVAEPIYGLQATEECLAALKAESESLGKAAQNMLELAKASRDAVALALLFRIEELGWEQTQAEGEMAGLSTEANAVGSCLYLLAQTGTGPGSADLDAAGISELIQLAQAHTEVHLAAEEVKSGFRDVSLLPPDRMISLQPNRIRNADIARWRRAIDRATRAGGQGAENDIASLSAVEVAALRREIEETGRFDVAGRTLTLPHPRPLLERLTEQALRSRRESFELELSFIGGDAAPLSGGFTVGTFLRVLAALQQAALMRRITLDVLSKGKGPANLLLMDLGDPEILNALSSKSNASSSEVSSVVCGLTSNIAVPGKHSDFRTESRPGSIVSGRRLMGSFAALNLHAVRWVEENLEADDCGQVFEDRVADALGRLGGQVTARKVEFALSTGERSEVDISFLWRDHLFLIECKARALGFGRVDRMKHAYEAIVEGAGQLERARRWLVEQPIDAEKRLRLRRNALRRISVFRFVALASPQLDELKVGEIRGVHAARVLSAGLRGPGDLASLLSEPIDPVVPEKPYLRSFGGRSFIVFP